MTAEKLAYKEREVRLYTRDTLPATVFLVPFFIIAFANSVPIAVFWLCVFYAQWTISCAIIWEKS